jgi:hypothetical protein
MTMHLQCMVIIYLSDYAICLLILTVILIYVTWRGNTLRDTKNKPPGKD